AAEPSPSAGIWSQAGPKGASEAGAIEASSLGIGDDELLEDSLLAEESSSLSPQAASPRDMESASAARPAVRVESFMMSPFESLGGRRDVFPGLRRLRWLLPSCVLRSRWEAGWVDLETFLKILRAGVDPRLRKR